jgi:transglutaminase superfamily protein
MTGGPQRERVASGTRRGWPRTWPEVRLVVHVAGLLLLLRLLLFCVKLKTLIRWLDAGPSARSLDPATLAEAARYTDALLARFSFPTRGNCLPRSLVIFHLARWWGLPVRFHCGIRRDGERLQGHAWLSLQGEPFLEANNPEENYVVTFSYPDTGEAAAGPAVTGASGGGATEPALRQGRR